MGHSGLALPLCTLRWESFLSVILSPSPGEKVKGREHDWAPFTAQSFPWIPLTEEKTKPLTRSGTYPWLTGHKCKTGVQPSFACLLSPCWGRWTIGGR